MSTFRKIRDRGDALSARLTKVANWYQQPNAVADKIIVSWQVKHTGEKYRTSVCLRDLFSGGLARRTRLAQCEVGQLADHVFAKLSAVIQTTDTSVAFPFKRCADQALEELRHEMRDLADEEEMQAIFKCQLYELIRVVTRALELLLEKQEPENTIQKASFANGWLAVLPDSEKGIMRPAHEAEWAKKYKLGNHRLKDSWVAKRFEGLSAEGKILELTSEDYKAAGVRMQAALNAEDLEDELETTDEQELKASLEQTLVQFMDAEEKGEEPSAHSAAASSSSGTSVPKVAAEILSMQHYISAPEPGGKAVTILVSKGDH